MENASSLAELNPGAVTITVSLGLKCFSFRLRSFHLDLSGLDVRLFKTNSLQRSIFLKSVFGRVREVGSSVTHSGGVRKTYVSEQLPS